MFTWGSIELCPSFSIYTTDVSWYTGRVVFC